MIHSIAIVGAGLMGRLVALSLHRQGYQVTLLDKDKRNAKNSAAYAAAGLLTPLGEAPQCENNIVEMGFASLKLWPDILATLEQDVFFQQQGSLLISHEQDQGDFLRFHRFIKQFYPQHRLEHIDKTKLQALEPELSHSFHQAISLPDEGQIDNVELLSALAFQLEKEGVNWLSETQVNTISIPENPADNAPASIEYCVLKNQQQKQHLTTDLVIDCRGIGAKKSANTQDGKALNELRAVRGEVFKLYAPDVKINRPIRLMHPRYQLYIAPKNNGKVSVGATQIESEDNAPITVRSALELLSATYSVCSGFAEANILEQISQLRPAFNNNQPKILASNKLIQVNGLFRHGYLIAPVVLTQVLAVVSQIKNNEALDKTNQYSGLLPITLLTKSEHANEYIH